MALTQQAVQEARDPPARAALDYDISRAREDVRQETDVKYHDISYWKFGKYETVHPQLFTPIDMQTALEKTKRLLWEYAESIGFTNSHNKDAVHIVRRGADEWSAEVPIMDKDGIWQGYSWHGTADTETILNAVEFFFGELNWFDLIRFEMGKRKDVEDYTRPGGP